MPQLFKLQQTLKTKTHSDAAHAKYTKVARLPRREEGPVSSCDVTEQIKTLARKTLYKSIRPGVAFQVVYP